MMSYREGVVAFAGMTRFTSRGFAYPTMLLKIAQQGKVGTSSSGQLLSECKEIYLQQRLDTKKTWLMNKRASQRACRSSPATWTNWHLTRTLTRYAGSQRPLASLSIQRNSCASETSAT